MNATEFQNAHDLRTTQPQTGVSRIQSTSVQSPIKSVERREAIVTGTNVIRVRWNFRNGTQPILKFKCRVVYSHICSERYQLCVNFSVYNFSSFQKGDTPVEGPVNKLRVPYDLTTNLRFACLTFL